MILSGVKGMREADISLNERAEVTLIAFDEILEKCN